MQTLTTEQLTLHYRYQAGAEDARTLVLLNSLGTDARIWDEVIGYLGDSFNILSYDKRGHGLSDVGEAPYTIDNHVDDTMALLAHLKIEHAIFCGVSVGGLIAQSLYHRAPEKVRGLILSNTADKIGDQAAWNTRIKSIEADGIKAIAPDIMQNWFSPEFHTTRPDQVRLYQNMLERCPVVGYVGTCAALRDTDLREKTARISAPTLCISGGKDKATPPEMVRAMGNKIQGAGHHLFEGTGHIPSIEVPEAMANTIKIFSAEIEG